MSLYSEIVTSCNKHSEQFVFDGELRYRDLLVNVEKRKRDAPEGGVLLAEISSGIEFVELLLAALRQSLVFCPVATESGDFDNAQKVLNPNLVYKNGEYSVLHGEVDTKISNICPRGGFVRFTSGTTGNAKGVLISDTSALERILLAEKSFQLSSDDNVLFLMSMPYHFVTSLFMMLKNGVCSSSALPCCG